MKTKTVLLLIACAHFLNAQMSLSVSGIDTPAGKTSTFEELASWQEVMKNSEMSEGFKKEVLPFLENDSSSVEQDQVFFPKEATIVAAIGNFDPEPFLISEIGGIYCYKTGEQNQIQVKIKTEASSKFLMIRATFDHDKEHWCLGSEPITIRTVIKKNSWLIYPKEIKKKTFSPSKRKE